MSPFTVNSPLYVLLRWAGFVSITLLVGAISFRLFVLPPLERQPRFADIGSRIQARLRIIAMLASCGVLLFTALRLAAQVQAFQAAAIPGQVISASAVLSGLWGTGWRIELTAAAVALGALVITPFARGGWHVAFLACVGGVAVGQALGGHATDASPMTTAVALDALHLLSASGWIGGIAMLLVAAFPALPPVDLELGASGRLTLLRHFSSVALSCAAVLALSGVYVSFMRLGSFAALWNTPYGRTLSGKILLVAAIVSLGAMNWRRFGPRADEPEAALALQRSARVELLLAAVVLALTAILVALPTPAEAG
jgi:putative copper export protein